MSKVKLNKKKRFKLKIYKLLVVALGNKNNY